MERKTFIEETEKNKKEWEEADARGDEAGKKAAHEKQVELTNEWDKETGGTSVYDEKTGVWNFSDGTYGDSETVKGNSYLDPAFDITEAKGYSSYEKALDELNENKFNYDVKKDKAYKALEKERKEMGEAAYRDIIGREAAKTLGSVGSYGVAAASQAYMDYMDSITDEIPELYELAYKKYEDEQERALNKVKFLYGNIKDEEDAFYKAQENFNETREKEKEIEAIKEKAAREGIDSLTAYELRLYYSTN